MQQAAILALVAGVLTGTVVVRTREVPPAVHLHVPVPALVQRAREMPANPPKRPSDSRPHRIDCSAPTSPGWTIAFDDDGVLYAQAQYGTVLAIGPSGQLTTSEHLDPLARLHGATVLFGTGELGARDARGSHVMAWHGQGPVRLTEQLDQLLAPNTVDFHEGRWLVGSVVEP